MPMLDSAPDIQDEPQGNARIPQRQQADVAAPGALDVAASAERSSNFVGQLYDNFVGRPAEDGNAEPGFNPVDHIPQGYLHDYGERFLDATNPAQVQHIKSRIDAERADQEILSRAKGWGTAASIAAGLTDPLSLASMALIPEAAPTRLGNALRWATMNAATTAGQEAISSQLSETRTLGESALNVGAGAVLGGVLGSIARRVPEAAFERTRADLGLELKPGSDENVMGPVQRSVLNDVEHQAAPLRDIEQPSESTVRLYHGGAEPPDSGGGRFVTEDLNYAKGYASKSEGGKVYYLDLPESHPELQAAGRAFDTSGTQMRSPFNHFETSEDLAKQMKELPEERPEATPSEIAPLPGEPAYVNPSESQSFGAAGVAEPKLADLTTARGGETIAKTIGKVAPAARVMTRTSLAARKLVTDLVNIPGTLAQNYRGIANADPIERRLWRYDGVHMQGLSARKEQYGAYLARVKQAGETPVSRRQFMDGVSSAMRRGDQHAIQEVAKAASATRKIVFQPLYDRAVKLGMVPEQAKLYADSYLTRQYDAVKIRKNMGQWIETLRQGFIQQGVDSAEATDIAHQASRNVMGSERGSMDWHAMDGIVPKAGNLKERTLSLPDHLLEPFLNSDIDHLSHSYLRSMAPEVEMTERFGSRDLKDQLADVSDDYARMIERARAEGDTAQMNALDKERDANIRDLSAMRDRLYGTYGAPKDPGSFFVRAGRLARSFNALRLLGAATLSHFPDLANVMMRYGLPNTMSAIARLMPSLEGIKLSLKEAQRMGAALDMTMNMSASLLGDYGSHSQYLEQRIGSGAARAFTIGTGETPLITLTQALTSTLAQDEIIRAAGRIARGQTVGLNRMANLAAAGIDQEMLGRIAAESQHVQRINGLMFGHSDRWADQTAARAFESAVLREAHGVTLRPGVGDTPLMMSSEVGKLVQQFKSFGYAASRSVTMPIAQGIAHGDIRSASALFALSSMGALSYVAKQKAAGQELETNPSRLALEIADKSNLMGWTSELIYPALWQAGFKNLSRWSDRDPAETLGGPTAGTLLSTFERQLPGRLAPNAMTQDELPFRRSDLHFLRRMAPGQNLWYARKGINTLEDGIGDLFDLPGESNKERALALNEQ